MELKSKKLIVLALLIESLLIFSSLGNVINITSLPIVAGENPTDTI